ncbi:hypothetical protein SC022_15765, partial [Ochrobactrum sp. BD18]|nr:hypothetical protein [Ochrobactrum sp. AP1BH01-1]
SSLQQSDLSDHPQTMPPTFLFLLYKIVKEQTVSKPSKISIRSPSPLPTTQPEGQIPVSASSAVPGF